MLNKILHKNISLKQFPALLLRLGIVLFCFTLNRIVFLLVNADILFAPNSHFVLLYWLKIFAGGIRFDLYSITILNSLFIFFTLIPFKFRYNTAYEKFTRITLFYIPNIIGFACDNIDTVYSRFTNKRMTGDVFDFLNSGGGFTNLIPQFLHDFWFMLVIFLIISSSFIIINNHIKIIKPTNKHYLSFFITNLLLLCLAAGTCSITSRGGIQPRPININTAALYSEPDHYTVVLNSSFTIIRTLGYQGLIDYKYFDDNTLQSIYTPTYLPNNQSAIQNNYSDTLIKPLDKKNIVIIILESFSAEYSALLNPDQQPSLTPTLDSLGKSGMMLLCYSNGTRSIEGVPAIISSVPTLMNSEYLASNYAGNKITSLPSLLKKYNYKSSFMHGSDNGTMYFDVFSEIAGYDYYYGRNEYNNEKDFDGYWGISDDKFLNYCCKQFDTISKPFFASIFTLSSHHPYLLPDYYLAKHPTEKRCMEESIKYADWSLKQFFTTASHSEWYNNTIFILVADHAFQSSDNPYFNNRNGSYKIPLVVFDPQGALHPTKKTFTQQLDILPTILDLINYPDTVFSFGKSIFDNSSPTFAINYLNNTYQFITDNYVIIFDGENITALYLRKDTLLVNNLFGKIDLPQDDISLMKAFIQQYNKSLIENRMSIPTPPRQ